MILTLIYFLLLSTNCTQEFSLSRASSKNIWIAEHVGGDCHYSKLIQIKYSDTLITSVESTVVEYKQTDSAISSYTAALQISLVELTKVGDHLTAVPPMSFTLKEPVADFSLLAKNFHDGVQTFPPSIVMPIFAGVHAKLLYQYEEGLYVNYQIDRAYLVPDNNILIVFTHNSLLTGDGATMSGFMIFLIQQ